jgi:hypothetical protein
LLAGWRAWSVATARRPLTKATLASIFRFYSFSPVSRPGFHTGALFLDQDGGRRLQRHRFRKQTNFELHLIAQANSFPLSEKSK